MQGCSVKAMRDGGKGIWNLTPRSKAGQFLVLVVTLEEIHWGTVSLGFLIFQAGTLLPPPAPVSLQADCEVQLQWDGTCQSIILHPPSQKMVIVIINLMKMWVIVKRKKKRSDNIVQAHLTVAKKIKHSSQCQICRVKRGDKGSVKLYLSQKWLILNYLFCGVNS